MERKHVKSSQIASIGFEPEQIDGTAADGAEESGILEIEFNGGSVYQYKASAAIHNEMMAAESAGKYFYAKIKGKLPYSKVIDGVAVDWIDTTKKAAESDA